MRGYLSAAPSARTEIFNLRTCVRKVCSLKTDPLQATVGQPYPTSYSYGMNNPNLYADPSGLRGTATSAVNEITQGCSTGGGSPYMDPAGIPIANAGTTKCSSSAGSIKQVLRPWEWLARSGSQGGLLLADLSFGGGKFEYKLEIQAAPFFGKITGRITRTGQPGVTSFISPYSKTWSSVMGSIARHTVSAGSYLISADGVNDELGTASNLLAAFQQYKTGANSSGAGLLSPSNGLPSDLKPFTVQAYRRRRI